MPSYTVSRKRYRKKRRKRKPNVYQLSKRISSLARRETMKEELKYLDTNVSISPSTSPTNLLLNGLTTGDTGSTREGQKIFIRSLNFKWNLLIADTTNVVRLLILYDRQPNGSAPPIADIFTFTGS
jgi:hypothetical protein